MTFDEWWEQAEKPFGAAKGFKEAALAGWKARRAVDAEICKRSMSYYSGRTDAVGETAIATATACAMAILEAE